MGFGTLFVGYFFILNFPYCAYTDALAALLMLYGLYKLSGINENFKRATYFTAVFALFGIAELFLELSSMFELFGAGAFTLTLFSLLRHFILGLTTAFMMLGIRDVAKEVGLAALKVKCLRGAYVSVAIYALSLILESTAFVEFFDPRFLAYTYVFTTFATLTVTIFNLVCIYTAYMRICMPDEREMEEKESKFGFVNAFRRHEEEKVREYAEYRLEKMKKKAEKKAKKGGK
jgi:hypothetical protein